jgi:hypothetical protein
MCTTEGETLAKELDVRQFVGGQRPAWRDRARLRRRRPATPQHIATAQQAHARQPHDHSAPNHHFTTPLMANPSRPTPSARNSTKVPNLPAFDSRASCDDDEHHVEHEGADPEGQAEPGDLLFAVAEHQRPLGKRARASTRSR